MTKACAGPALMPMYQFLKGYFKAQKFEVKRDEELGKQIEKIVKTTDKDVVNSLNKKLVEYGLPENVTCLVKFLNISLKFWVVSQEICQY